MSSDLQPTPASTSPDNPPESGVVFTSNLNNLVFLHTKHHVANTRHIAQTNCRVKDGLESEIQQLEIVEDNALKLSVYLDESATVLSTLTRQSRPALIRTRLMLTETVSKEKIKQRDTKT